MSYSTYLTSLHTAVDRRLADDKVFFTGPAGTEKSVVIRALRRVVYSKLEKSKANGEDQVWLHENDCVEH
jgi:hypothetical protein